MQWSKKLPTTFMPFVRWRQLLPTVAMAILTVVLLDAAVDAWHARAEQVASQAARRSKLLKLQAKIGAEQMEVSWDHESAAIQGAERGMLHILDGDVNEIVPFDAAQLHDGVLIYRPRSNDLSVRLEISERDGRELSESVRAVRLP